MTKLNELEGEKGYWWFPDAPEYRFAGRLNIDQSDHIFLEITEKKERPDRERNFNEYPLIYGETVTGKKISLLSCLETGSGWAMTGIQTRKIEIGSVAEGALIPSDSSKAKFRSASALWPNLMKWFGVCGLSTHWDKSGSYSVDISYRPPDALVFNLDQDLSITINFTLDSHPYASSGSELNLHEVAWLTLSSSDPQDLDYFLDKMRTLREFFSIAMSEYCNWESLSFESNFEKRRLSDNAEHFVFLNLYLREHYEQREGDMPHPRKFLFSYGDVSGNFEKIIKSWFDKSKEMTPIKSLYFSSLYGYQKYIESDFLSFAQSVEVYHRRFRGGQYLSNEEYEKIILQPLLGVLPSSLKRDVRDVFKSKLGYLNEYSLRQRLKELFRENENIFTKLIPSWKDVVDRIVEERNYYTHYSDDKRDHSPNIDELIYDTYVLQALLELSLITECGVDRGILEKSAVESYFHRHFFPILKQ